MFLNRIIKYIFSLFLLIGIVQNVSAEDYYIHAGSTIGSGTPESPANFTQLKTYLSSYNVNNAASSDLNLYFQNGTYLVSSGGLSFGSSTNTSYLKVNFLPWDENPDVTFQGAGNGSVQQDVKFITTTGSSNMVVNLERIKIQNFTSQTGELENGTNSLFTIGGTTTVKLQQVEVKDISSRRNPLVSIGNNGAFIVDNSRISEITRLSNNSYAIFETGYSGVKLSFTNSVLDKWQVSANSGNSYARMFWLEDSNPTLEMINCTISDCVVKNHLIDNYNSGGIINISNCTFTNNTTTSGDYIIYARQGAVTIYNNTFSSNSGFSRSISVETSNTIVLNNTFYNSGLLQVTNSNVVVRNNLAFGSSTIRVNNATIGNAVQNNITDNSHFPESLPVTITAGQIKEFSSYVNPTLKTDLTIEGVTATHSLLKVDQKDHPILRQGNAGEYTNLLATDQRGKRRPEKISIGAWDLPTYAVVNGTYTILYDPEKGFEPNYFIDLSEYVISYPDNINLEDTRFEILSYPVNGTLTLNNINEYQYDFVPKKDSDDETLPAKGTIGVPFDLVFKIYNNIDNDSEGLKFEEEVILKIIIIDISKPMGLIDESILRCFTHMEQVDFDAEYKFESMKVNPTNHRYDGFTIPLIGDLNGDGKPEIVVMGISDATGSALGATATYIYILSGQTGEELVRYALPTTWVVRDPPHNTPSWMALVDSDRNGRAEIVVAFGYASDQKYRNRLVSYEVNAETFSGGDITNKNKLTEKWISDVRFDLASDGVATGRNYRSVPLPQVIDIDGDGAPEILVYNKIYDAKTGQLKITLENLEPLTTWNTTSRTIDYYRDYAYIGRNRHTNYGAYDSDKNLNFSYVYDLDGDGNMEVIAGGKVYYDLNPHTGNWKVKSADNSNFNLKIGDGYTAVADINGDGKAEIVVVSYPDGSSQNYLRIVVWDPKFVIKDRSGNWIKNPDVANDTPEILADMTVNFQYQERQGTHSYVYIGDIDGLIQEVNGEERKYPEITILGSRFYYGTNIPWHPAVKEKFDVPDRNNYTGNTSGTARGAIMSWTWDNKATTVDTRLKVSFLMEHDDRSLNTGFTMFDFDNDGIQEICYRDEKTLRIVAASKPFVKLDERSEEVMRFREVVKSFTGYEYPVIADLDGDGSANIVVMGSPHGDDARGYVYAVHAKVGTEKFAPAPKVWNQFMYHPLKINEDLTTPRVNLHPLSPKLAYIKGEDYKKGRMIKTYIYNNTTTQVVKSALFDMPALAPDEGTVKVLMPVVPIADAVALHGKIEIDPDGNSGRLKFYVKNIGDATLVAQTPIRIFKEDENGNELIPGGLYNSENLTLGKDVFKGDSTLISIELPGKDLHYTYTIRITDHSTSTQDLFMTDPNYEDCNWADNVIQVGDFVVRYDAVTLLQFTTIDINVLANDSLPVGADRILTEDMIRPISTGDIGTWQVINNSLRYTAPESYPGGVIEFEYTLQYNHSKKTAKVYIYVMESCMNGFSVCTGSQYYVCLEENPEGIFFDWYDEEKAYIGIEPPVVKDMQGDRIYYAKPNFKEVKTPESVKYKSVNFPMGKVIIKLLPVDNGLVTAKWTGLFDTSWYNPYNWVEIKEDGIEVPVTWTPTGCVNVIITEDAYYYPQLNTPTACGNIKMENRAMISGIHYLQYDQAEVELALSPQEKNRFMMWSAPLKAVYTGDYHFKDMQGNPTWGDVYMSFFQATNPDIPESVATENMFTATFGNLETRLDLGTPFITKVTNLKEDAVFRFPQKFTQYGYDINVPSTSLLDRENGTRFIVDKSDFQEDGTLKLPVKGDNNFRVIHIVNPFMAYLDVGKFLERNKEVLEQAYKVWDGNIEGEFITVKPANESGRYEIVSDLQYFEENNLPISYIAPLQSFFVMKKDKDLQVNELQISSDMITVMHVTSDNGLNMDYEGEILRIQVIAGGNTNSTIIHNKQDVSRAYNGNEDASKLFNSSSAVSVYTLTDKNEPLDIYSTDDFSKEIKLGVKVKEEGEVKLEFEGIDTFSHDVYLIDHAKNNKVIDLRNTSSYTFTVTNNAKTNPTIELNERFSLHFNSATQIEEEKRSELIVYAESGKIYVQAVDAMIEEIQVISAIGNIVYNNTISVQQHEIAVPQKQVYIIKAKVAGEQKVIKVPVK